MNPVGALGSLSTGVMSSLKQGECTAQSIVKALDNFLNAVNHMKDIVMVPSRLKDLTLAIQIPSGGPGGAVVPGPGAREQMDLFTFYRMLHAVRTELVCGAGEAEMMTEVDVGDDQGQHIAAAFRQHLHGLFGILHQLTDTANYLSKRYQDEVEIPSNGA